MREFLQQYTSPQAMPIWHIFVFWMGACVGSFLNVCIWRIPRDESVITPPSHCPGCDSEIAWYDNLPLISWVVLGGKCRHCKNSISSRYFFVELLTAVLFSVVWFKVLIDGQPITVLIPYFGMTMLIVTTTYIDLDHRLIPSETTFPAMALGVVASLIFPSIWQPKSGMCAIFPDLWHTNVYLNASVQSIGGLLVAYIGMALFAVFGKMLFKKEALGGGDVKYLAAVGACLGIWGAFFTIMLGAILGAIGGVVCMLIRKFFFSQREEETDDSKKKTAASADKDSDDDEDQDGKHSHYIPFGPYLAAGTYLWMVFGLRILRWYFDWILSHK